MMDTITSVQVWRGLNRVRGSLKAQFSYVRVRNFFFFFAGDGNASAGWLKLHTAFISGSSDSNTFQEMPSLE